MYAHKIRVIVEPSADLVVKLPPDFPSGFAEVIVLSETASNVASPSETPSASGATRTALLEKLAQRLPQDPALGRIVFHDDPVAPLDESDWPEVDRP